MRDEDAALEWARRQQKHPTQSWYNLCQSFVRQAYGVPAWAPSAKAAWDRIPARNRKKTPFEDIPRGAAIYFNIGTHGHVMIATKRYALSNDYKAHGQIDKVPRDIPAWGGPAHYLGWSFWTPYGVLPHD